MRVCRVLALGLDTLQRCLAWEKLPSQAERPFLQALLSSLLQDSQRAVASGSSWDARKVRPPAAPGPESSPRKKVLDPRP